MKTGVENALPTPGGGNGKSWQLSLYDQHRAPHEPITDNTEITVSPRSLNSELMCPICLDMLKNTMTTKECLHRFCQECITTALRSGNKECPTCRKKLVSKRSLRPDPNFDALIAKLYPDRKEYEAMQERALARLSKHYNTEALQKSIEEGMKLQAQLRKMHRAPTLNTTATPHEDGAASGERRNKRRKREDGSRRQTPDRESSLGELSASEASANHFSKNRASEVELILKPHPDTEREPTVAPVVKQTRYLKTTANATMDHLATYLSIRVKLDADDAMRNSVESSLEAFKTLKPMLTSSTSTSSSTTAGTDVVEEDAAAKTPAVIDPTPGQPTISATTTTTTTTETDSLTTSTATASADKDVTGTSNKAYQIYVDQAGTNNQPQQQIVLLPGNLNLETVLVKYWSVKRPLELYFSVPIEPAESNTTTTTSSSSTSSESAIGCGSGGGGSTPDENMKPITRNSNGSMTEANSAGSAASSE